MIAIPVIDLTAARTGGRAERLRTAREIDDACREIGFFTIWMVGYLPAATSCCPFSRSA